MKKKITAVLCFLLVCGALSAPAAEKEKETYSDRELAIITKMVTRIFSSFHYRKQNLDDKVSEQMFDAYFKQLDPNRSFFLQSDVDRFLPEREKLDDMLWQGDVRFAFDVYEIYRRRIAEYRSYAEKMLADNVDFSIDEEIVLDRSKTPWPKTRAELENIWRLKLKRDLLFYRLSDRAYDEALKKSNDQKNSISAEEKKQMETARRWGGTPQKRVLRRLRDLCNVIEQRERIDVVALFLNSLAAVYGPHSSYMQPKSDEDFDINMSLSLTGIGATLTSDDGYIKVVELVPGGPAAVDGRLKIDDRIIAVAQENQAPVDVIDMPVDKAVRLIRGPVGTKVTLTTLPGSKGRNALPVQITLTRAKVRLVESEAKGEVREINRPDGKGKFKIGIIELPSFYMDFDAAFRGETDYKSCSRDVKKILQKFQSDKIDALVFDLRRNGGGSFPEAITMAGLFVPTAPIVQLRSGNQETELKKDPDRSCYYDGPMLILTSKLTASSSEIFSGALRDLNRAIVVGDSRTFGKGTVLNVVPLDRYLLFAGRNFKAGSVTHESAMFYRIAGGSVQQLGIRSDIVLPSLTEHMEFGEMFLDHHLPWDEIPKVRYSLYDPDLEQKLPALREKSAKRIASDQKYQKLIRRIEFFKQRKAHKTLSLNEEKRWKEYQNEEQLQKDEELLDNEKSSTELRKKKKLDDVELDEAVNIAADLALAGKPGSKK